MEQKPQDEQCASQLKALGDPVRLQIIRCLQAGEMTVSDVKEVVDLDLANASHHLRLLKASGIALSRREGKYIYYSLNPAIYSARNRSSDSIFDLGCCRFTLPREEKS